MTWNGLSFTVLSSRLPRLPGNQNHDEALNYTFLYIHLTDCFVMCFMCHSFVSFYHLSFLGDMYHTKIQLVNPPPRGIWMHSVCLSVCLSVRLSVCNISCLGYNLLMHWCITIYLGTNGVLIDVRSDLDRGPYLKGQGHTTYLKVRVHMLMSALMS